MMRKKILLLLAALLIFTPLCMAACPQGDQGDGGVPAVSGKLTDQVIREQGLSAVDDSTQGRSSMFIWGNYFFTGGAVPALSEVLAAYQIDRVYQWISQPWFKSQELLDMVHHMALRDTEVVALNGDTSWLEDGLDEYKDWIDSLEQYNQAHTHHQISAVALDVEGHTLDAFQEDPVAGFADYCRSMEDAYQYAHDRGLRVIQIIPTSLDTIDQEQFEWFLEHCCDEISIMNYRKSTALSAIWNEVQTCRRLDVPVETIFETMPIDSKHSVTEDITYFYEGTEALDAAVEEMRQIYGSSLSIGYHHFETLYHLHTGLYLARIYPYAKAKADGNQNGQIKVGDWITLRSKKAEPVSAWLSPADPGRSASEFSYLAVGVQTNVRYTVGLESSDCRVTGNRTVRFKWKDGKLVYADSFHAEPKD